ncbi:hypothetical protein CDD81_4058 [Ophiocordyceps australis]|uniref:Uncharacterized protein n=1 Tax=Ophiocordyceps australis TaxID=1399860 RepID=A0A2C5XR84_9HYPO|nr:hypothetical protein CDD81_4058 [Ophiocordyceps australis]
MQPVAISTHDPSTQRTNRPIAASSPSRYLPRASNSFEHPVSPEGFSSAASNIASSLLSRHPLSTVDSSALETSISTDSPPRAQEMALDPVLEDETLVTSSEVISKDIISKESRPSPETRTTLLREPLAAAPFPNGYHFPPKHSWGESVKLGCLAFWDYLLTPLGFLVTVYGLNVVAWGGMLFLLLCNASPAMCTPTCDDINSPRRKWVEIDSQILNALFCVTGFGLAPWRLRDTYLLIQYRCWKKHDALRRLAAIHNSWFRLAHSNELPANLSSHNWNNHSWSEIPSSAIPLPEDKMPEAPLTGVRARATKPWLLDLVIWLMLANTLLQCCLSGFMWGLNRYNRPSWSTGLFVALGCGVAAIGGAIMFAEAKTIKSIEGVPVSQEDQERLQRDHELGIWHFNNIKDKRPKDPAGSHGP